jgi:hypothetical protein
MPHLYKYEACLSISVCLLMIMLQYVTTRLYNEEVL